MKVTSRGMIHEFFLRVFDTLASFHPGDSLSLRAQRSKLGGREKGFSLVEILTALLIFGVLAGLTTLNFANTRAIYKLRGATWEVASRLQATRMAAVKENSRYLFSVSGPTLHIHKDENGNGLEDDGEPLTTRDLSADSAGVAFTASGLVTFTARGTTLAPVTITITNQSGDSKTVIVNRAGRVSIS